MSTIKDLEPNGVWRNFYSFTQIPRPSKKEAKVIAFMKQCGEEHGLETIIGTEGGAIGLHPTVFDMGFNRIVFEIMYFVGILLGNHVQVGLQDDTFAVLHARRGRLAHDDIAAVFNNGFQTMFFAPLLHESDYFCFFLLRARNLC